MSVTGENEQEKVVPDGPLLLKAADVARRLQLGRATVYQMMASGELPTVHKGRAVRVPTEGLHAWIKRQTRESL